MIKDLVNNSFNFGLQTLGFLPNRNREWNAILREINANNLNIIEFKPKLAQNNYWALLIEPILETKENQKTNVKYFNRRLNQDLKSAFATSEPLVSGFWSSFFSNMKLSGFYIPVKDIQNIKPAVLKSHLDFYQLLLKHFQYENFFSALEKNKIDLNENDAPHAIWLFIYYYSKFLHQLKKDFYGLYELYGNWFSEQLDLDNFHCRLPSEQITILLLNRCEAQVSNTDQDWQKRRILSSGSYEVKSFFKKHNTDLGAVFGEIDEGLKSDILTKSHVEMKDEFAAIFLNDYDELLLQDVLDNQSKLGLSNAFPFKLQLRYGSKSLYNISGVIKDNIFNAFERPAGEFKEDDDQLPKYKQVKRSIYPKNVQYWYDLMPAEKDQILSWIQQNSTDELIAKYTFAIESRCQDHLINLINLISAPILVWKKKDKNLFPQWNLFEDEEANNFKETYQQKKKDNKEEKEILKQHLEAIFKLKSLDEIVAYQASNKLVFVNDEFQKKWKTELERMSYRLSQKEKFLENRMREFGISETNLGKKEKGIWLQEMLNIEDEIKPYIQYVKKAFQTALPVRRKVTFSKDRHVSDGVEFDPDTLFDQEKWIRADVMKVMESKTERGEAIQINTFCLDYSGSMIHDRMRNLFKILYLLVLGLEDRKSYDAFHFFSNNFISVVDFSSEFTNRKVLFQIMLQISKLENGEVKFLGDGGTNISAGIGVSHEKMKTFVEEYRAKHPKANIVTSMFVITDGQPSLGIIDIPMLNEFIEAKRQDGDVEIKGIFIKSELDMTQELMKNIFGEDNYVETSDFQEGVNKFVKIMTETYKKQRKAFKWKQKKQKLGLTE